jgi:hypothetical protein
MYRPRHNRSLAVVNASIDGINIVKELLVGDAKDALSALGGVLVLLKVCSIYFLELEPVCNWSIELSTNSRGANQNHRTMRQYQPRTLESSRE